jgi:hypothetical protein
MPRALRRRHWEMLILALIIAAAAFLLTVRSDDRVAMLGADSVTLPPLCMSRSLFGISCPGCGLTRSFVELAHGDWERARSFHRVGWFVALGLLLQVPYRLVALRHPTGLPLGTLLPRLFGYAIIVALIGNWVAGLLGL